MNGPPHQGDVAALVVIGLITAIGAVVWLWGGLAGLLFGAGWPHAAIARLPGVIVRLPARLGDPAAAWPAAARDGLPGPLGFYTALLLLGGAAAAVARLATAAGIFRSGGGGGGARWATGGELRPLKARSGRSARLTLGRHHGRLLRAEHRHALVAFGPPQSGKSAGLAVPALLEWHGPAVASSIKTDLLGATSRRRHELGPVFVFDPFTLSGVEGQTWSPLHGASTWDGALEVAWRLAAAGELDQRAVEGGDFWAVAAEQRLAPLLFTAAASGGGIESVVRWAYGQGSRELDEALFMLTETARDEAQLEGAHAA
ncbi:MAG TPA: type IV secretory system conjugative DNA transfer family protein, partial [Solirubrobacteraceae bacterium]|nr:type IV secretory system conjugative DNA transfer family protein [Solirubrobacteraceae bacterium]